MGVYFKVRTHRHLLKLRCMCTAMMLEVSFMGFMRFVLVLEWELFVFFLMDIQLEVYISEISVISVAGL